MNGIWKYARIFSFLLVIVLLLGAAGTYAQDSDRFGGTFKAAMTTKPPTLDPYLSTNTVLRQVASYMFESLVTFDENYQVIPQIARKWEVGEDDLTYTFHLREGVLFHDGSELTSEDVVASFNRYASESVGKERVKLVESIKAVDEYTVQFKLSEPTLFLTTLAIPDPVFGIMPAEQAAKTDELQGPDELIGTGPYKLVEWKPDQYVKLTRFDDYVADEGMERSGLGGKKVAYFDEIQLIPVPEAGSRIAGIKTGEYHYAESIPFTEYKNLQSAKRVTPVVVKPKWGLVWELNQKNAPMDNVKFRRAVAYALDMEQVMKGVTFGMETFYRLQPSIFFPEQKTWYTEAGGEHYNVKDMEKVRELLDEAGYENEKITVLSNRDYDWMYKCTLAAVSQLQQAGINAEIEFSDWPTQIEKALSMKGWHINQTGWSPRLSPAQLSNSLACDSKFAYGYCNEEMEELLSEVVYPYPLEERQEIWRQIQELVWEDVAVIRMGDYFALEAVAADVKGFESWYVIPRFWNVWFEG